MTFPVALQMYTLRNEMEQDYFGAFRKAAEIGFQGVELELPPSGIPARQVKDFLDQLGLQWVACHVDNSALTTELDRLLNALDEVGCKNMVLSYLEYHSKQAVTDAAHRFNEIGAACRKRGIQFLYHNHNHEFEKYDGKSVLDLLLELTDPALVKFEMDTYWVQRAGVDPAAYLLGLKGRCPLLHIKDMEAGPEQFFAEIGAGTLNFDAIFRAARTANVQWLIVEQDECRKPPFESVALSYHNLQKMGI